MSKIKVDYDACIACEACAKACPSTVMNAILKQQHTIPDCFACGNCISDNGRSDNQFLFLDSCLCRNEKMLKQL